MFRMIFTRLTFPFHWRLTRCLFGTDYVNMLMMNTFKLRLSHQDNEEMATNPFGPPVHSQTHSHTMHTMRRARLKDSIVSMRPVTRTRALLQTARSVFFIEKDHLIPAKSIISTSSCSSCVSSHFCCCFLQ